MTALGGCAANCDARSWNTCARVVGILRGASPLTALLFARRPRRLRPAQATRPVQHRHAARNVALRLRRGHGLGREPTRKGAAARHAVRRYAAYVRAVRSPQPFASVARMCTSLFLFSKTRTAVQIPKRATKESNNKKPRRTQQELTAAKPRPKAAARAFFFALLSSSCFLSFFPRHGIWGDCKTMAILVKCTSKGAIN